MCVLVCWRLENVTGIATGETGKARERIGVVNLPQMKFSGYCKHSNLLGLGDYH